MRVHALSRGLAILVLEVGALVLLYRGGLPSVDWFDLGRWLDETPPEDAILAVVRIIALASTGYLIVTTLLVILASVAKVPALVRGARLVSLPGLRRVIEGVAAVSVATAPIVSAATVVAAPAVPTDVPSYTPTPAGDTARYEPTPAGDDVEQSHVHVVVAGESLWLIAEDSVPAGIPDRAAAVDAYWRRLLDLNTSTLRSGDPNLIFPGEVVNLP